MELIAIIGASGYVGRHLVAALIKTGGYRIKVLSRGLPGKDSGMSWPEGVEVTQGDLQDPQSVQTFIERGCTVVNLAYLWHAGESGNLSAMQHLLNACEQVKVKRLIHCSTAIVVGEVAGGWVTENTPCKPSSLYECTKLKIEQAVLGRPSMSFDTVILRPTSVFGPAALPLKKFTDDLVGGNQFLNYLKACFLGRRRMNLIPIANVVAAVLFMISHGENINGEVFIVSNDDDARNNFSDVERTLMHQLNCKRHIIPPIPMPYFLLRLVLGLFRKPAIKPSCNFSSEKLKQFGFANPLTFEAGLIEYADWYRSNYLDRVDGSPI